MNVPTVNHSVEVRGPPVGRAWFICDFLVETVPCPSRVRAHEVDVNLISRAGPISQASLQRFSAR